MPFIVYIPSLDTNKNSVIAVLTREFYLVDNLKANILVRIDIISPEDIDIITSIKKAYIRSYDIVADITIKPLGL